MECFDLKITNDIDTNLIYPLTCAAGVIITYFGNRFVKPTIFCLGTILSIGSSYKLIDFIMGHFKYKNCLVHAGGSILSGLSGGFLLLILYFRVIFFMFLSTLRLSKISVLSDDNTNYLIYVTGAFLGGIIGLFSNWQEQHLIALYMLYIAIYKVYIFNKLKIA